MDEAAYRQKLSEAIERPCAFEKSILTSCVACEHSLRIQIAEREALTCRNVSCHSACTALHEQLRHSFVFALGRSRDQQALPHAQEMRVQCGGLKGLQQVLNGRAEVDNVAGLVAQASRQWGELAEIPWSEVVHAAAQCYKGRHG